MSEPDTTSESGKKCTNVYYRSPSPDAGLLAGPGCLSALHEDLAAFVRTTVADAGAEGVVVAMSGGIDSTVTAALAVEALGGDRVLGLGLPCNKTDDAAEFDARTIAEGLGIDYRSATLRPLLALFDEEVAPALEPGADGSTTVDPLAPGSTADSGPADDRATGNAVARLRACCAYYAANRSSRLVLGTANRSERLLGYFTKYGDGAADCYPLGDCYKTEVRALASHIGVPRRVISREPTAGFWAGQTDAGELGAPYERIDPFLERLVDRGLSVAEAADAVDIDVETARDLARRHRESAHKRATPPTPGLGLDRP